MMKKITTLTIATFAVIALSACGSDVEQAQETIKEEVQQQVQEKVQEKAQEVKENAEGIVKGTVKDLMAMGQKQKCTWETPEAKGVVYLDGNKMRTDVTMLKVEGDMPDGMEVNTIDDGEWIYTWNNKTNAGTKFKSEAIDETNEEMMEEMDDMPIDTPEEMMEEKTIEYKCVKWTGNGKMFTPPANIEFKDMTVMMQGGPMTPPAMTQEQINQNQPQMDMEGICNMAPTPEQKKECMKEVERVQQQKGVPQ
jgi:hypothetical protein